MAGATKQQIEAAEKITGHVFTNKQLVRSALTHPSATENKPISESYERLEFLGDSILGGMVAADLFSRFPDMDEGGLSQMKIALVSGATLSRVADELGLSDCIFFGESERGTGARGMHSALENVYEALVAALYLDAGFDAAHSFVVRTLSPHMSRDLSVVPVSSKSRLQAVIQSDAHLQPEDKIISQEGPAHQPTFVAVVMVDGKHIGRGSGPSKKSAQTAAAHDALQRMGIADTDAL